ncbi:hypothetical protein ACLOJK_016641 [Asimina triloba]
MEVLKNNIATLRLPNRPLLQLPLHLESSSPLQIFLRIDTKSGRHFICPIFRFFFNSEEVNFWAYSVEDLFESWEEEWGKMFSAALKNEGSVSFDVASDRTLYPIVPGTSVIGVKYKDGILMAADMGDQYFAYDKNVHRLTGSYGSTLRCKSVERMKPIGKHTLLGTSGEISDFQEILCYLDELILYDNMWDDGNSLGPKEVHSYLNRVMYNRRNKFDPLWNSRVLGGVKNGQKSAVNKVQIKKIAVPKSNSKPRNPANFHLRGPPLPPPYPFFQNPELPFPPPPARRRRSESKGSGKRLSCQATNDAMHCRSSASPAPLRTHSLCRFLGILFFDATAAAMIEFAAAGLGGTSRMGRWRISENLMEDDGAISRGEENGDGGGISQKIALKSAIASLPRFAARVTVGLFRYSEICGLRLEAFELLTLDVEPENCEFASPSFFYFAILTHNN